MGNNQKWLLALLNSISLTQWFFLAFGSITLFFIRLMMNHQNKMTQRNFKKEERGNSSNKKMMVLNSNKREDLTKKD